MNLPDSCRLTYTVAHEAWYYRAAHEHQQLRGGETGRYLMIHASAKDGGMAWEFRVDQYQFSDSNPAIRLGMFDDSFAAFEQIPEFFRLLAAQRPVTLDPVRVILDSLGATDETQRETPERYRGVERDVLARKVAEAQAELDAYDTEHGANV